VTWADASTSGRGEGDSLFDTEFAARYGRFAPSAEPNRAPPPASIRRSRP
jgi:hypothetical protein